MKKTNLEHILQIGTSEALKKIVLKLLKFLVNWFFKTNHRIHSIEFENIRITVVGIT